MYSFSVLKYIFKEPLKKDCMESMLSEFLHAWTWLYSPLDLMTSYMSSLLSCLTLLFFRNWKVLLSSLIPYCWKLNSSLIVTFPFFINRKVSELASIPTFYTLKSFVIEKVHREPVENRSQSAQMWISAPSFTWFCDLGQVLYPSFPCFEMEMMIITPTSQD